MMTLKDLQFLKETLLSRFDLDTNYNSEKDIQVDPRTLTKWPYDGDRTKADIIEAHGVYMRLAPLISGLEVEAKRATYGSAAFALQTQRVHQHQINNRGDACSVCGVAYGSAAWPTYMDSATAQMDNKDG